MQWLYRGLLILLIGLGIGLSFAEMPEEQGVIHIVQVWLKEPGNLAHRKQIIAGSKKLRNIPGVQDLRVGSVVPSDREVVDSSYDVALYLRFDSQGDLQKYLEHPIHKNTVKATFVPIMEKFRVLDFRDE